MLTCVYQWAFQHCDKTTGQIVINYHILLSSDTLTKYNCSTRGNLTVIIAHIILFIIFIYKLRTQCRTIIAETVQNNN